MTAISLFVNVESHCRKKKQKQKKMTQANRAIILSTTKLEVETFLRVITIEIPLKSDVLGNHFFPLSNSTIGIFLLQNKTAHTCAFPSVVDKILVSLF